MTVAAAVEALNQSFLRDFPREAAREIEKLPESEAAPALTSQDGVVLAGVWEYLLPDTATRLLRILPDEVQAELLRTLDPGHAAALLDRLTPTERDRCLDLLTEPVARELRQLLAHAPDSAGRLMDTRVMALRGEMVVGEALTHLRRTRRPGRVRFIYLIDDVGRLEGGVDLQDLALSDDDVSLRSLARPVQATVSVMDPQEEIVTRLEQFHLEELPVLDIHGRLLGVIRSEVLLQTLQDDASADLQMMVGVSRDERALSPVAFAARKRIVWMHINLVTAFVAASVVGLFEGTIAQFTALAVLMPVVAGMGGNMGAQALAVTLRGIALREITVRHWFRVLFKEARVGLLNGVIIALTTSLAVFLWSGNSGLALVIGLAMVISLNIACVAGAMVPLVLTRIGQDPAQSSSIFLTTITDITGFMSFLGIATLLSALLL